MKCLYYYDTENSSYNCQVTSGSIRSFSRTISSLSGKHVPDKSDQDINEISFDNIYHKLTVKYFPKGMKQIFSNLTSVKIHDCELKEITKNDFEDLQQLEKLSLKNNKLATLPSDLFENMPWLISIEFNGNKLKFFSSKVVKPLMNNELELIDFRGNISIDSFYGPKIRGGVRTVEELMRIINKNCTKQRKEANCWKAAHTVKMSKGFASLWESGNLSDFTIIVGLRKFRVHKTVLSIHSPVLAGMFGQAENIEKEEMNISEVNSEGAYDFLRFLYTGDLPDLNNAMFVFALAAKLEVNELSLICEQIICEDVLSDSSAYDIFMLGQNFNSETLKLAAFNQIKAMFPDANVPDHLMKDPENLKKLIEANELLQS